MLRGAIAASVTPLREGGAALDEAAVGPLVDELCAGGIDGILALGTTGEGILLSTAERRRALERFLAEAAGRVAVAAHCGAQTTADTAALAAHAAEVGAGAVAVIAPPYYALDHDAILAHLAAAAKACAPLPFYVYEFQARSGYAVPPDVVSELAGLVPNLAGMKVSDTPFDRVAPYLGLGLDLFVGSEPLIPEGLARGAAGTVSGLAAAFPELVVALLREPSPEARRRVAELRGALDPYPFQAALKHVLRRRGVPLSADVRPPLRALRADELAAVDRIIDQHLAAVSR
jgi:dihydrodipicolinate synthase/N-acetylneuraminate lyase